VNPQAIAAALRAKGKSSAKAAPMADIYGYIDNLGTTSFGGEDPGTAHGGEAGMGTTGAGVEWADIGNQAEGQTPEQTTFTPDARFNGAVTRARSDTEGGPGAYRFHVDPSLLPQTRFGDVTRSAQVNPHTRLRDPSMVYDDPNYGRITDHRNVDTSSVGPMLVSLAAGGIGGLASAGIGAAGAAGSSIPGWATSGIRAAQSFGNGDFAGGAGGILGALGSVAGLPSWATQIGRYALSNALRRKKG
jgi:hypothetical protein